VASDHQREAKPVTNARRTPANASPLAAFIALPHHTTVAIADTGVVGAR
jgi:hypothetical protein